MGEGKWLVLAIEEDAGVDILYRCGAYAKCTTCRVQFLEGGQVRLSCGVVCDRDMGVRPLTTVTSTGLDGPGAKPGPEIAPRPSGWGGPPRGAAPQRKFGTTSLANFSTGAGS